MSDLRGFGRGRRYGVQGDETPGRGRPEMSATSSSLIASGRGRGMKRATFEPGSCSQKSEELNREPKRAKEYTNSDSRLFGMMNSSTDAVMMAPKLSSGQNGNKIKLISNHFPINLPKGIVFYRYIVKVTVKNARNEKVLSAPSGADYLELDRKEKCRLLLKCVMEKNEKYFGNKYNFVYDRCCALFSRKQLDFDSQARSFEVDKAELPVAEGMDWKRTTVAIVEISELTEGGFELNLDDIQSATNPNLTQQNRVLLQFMELLTSQYIFNSKDFAVFGNSLCLMRQPEKYKVMGNKKMQACRELVAGVSKGCRVVEGKGDNANGQIVAVIDAGRALMYQERNVIDLIADLLKIKPHEISRKLPRTKLHPTETSRIRQELIGVFVKTTYGELIQEAQVTGIAVKPADKTGFNWNGVEISVSDYFEKKYNLKLKYANLPCLLAGPRKNQYPMELCQICPHQRISLEKQAANCEPVTRDCALLPNVRLKEISKDLDALHLNEKSNNKWLAQLQAKVLDKPIQVDGRVIDPPVVHYCGKSVGINKENANWRMPNYTKFFQAIHLASWTCVVSDRDERGVDDSVKNTVSKFIGFFVRECVAKGMNIKRPDEICYINPDEIKLEEMIKHSAKEGNMYLMLIQSRRSELHHYLKLLESQYMTVATQDLKMETVEKIVNQKGGNVLGNIVMKTNIKLGGLNHKLTMPQVLTRSQQRDFLNRGDVLIFSYDVSHPTGNVFSRGLSPSVVGFAYNCNRNPLEFVGDFALQEARQERVEEGALKSTVCYVIDEVKKNRGLIPSEIIIYRDGLSEGQYHMAINVEARIIRQALASYAPPGESYAPKLSFIVVQKRHKTRVFHEDLLQRRQGDRNLNVPPNTVVDTGIVNPNYQEFYLISHKAFQGTVKAVKCTILVNDMNITSDECQQLTLALCYDHQIITQSISLPVSVHMADEWAKRGKNDFVTYRDNKEKSGKWNNEIDLEKLTNKLSYRGKPLHSQRVNA